MPRRPKRKNSPAFKAKVALKAIPQLQWRPRSEYEKILRDNRSKTARA